MIIETDFSFRVESGPVTFVYENGTADYTGLFLRGDDAFNVACVIGEIDAFLKDKIVGAEKQNWYLLYFNQLKALASDIKRRVVQS